MSKPDLNLLVTLDVLLAEGSVARAAQRLRLSPSAMSRQLARLRVGPLVEEGKAVLGPAQKLSIKNLVRTFTLRTNDGFVENFGPELIARIGKEAPGVRLRFVQKPDKDSAPLRDGAVDLETGVMGKMTGPELRVSTRPTAG
jgi:DNA-binding transcriptional LysR family regulator